MIKPDNYKLSSLPIINYVPVINYPANYQKSLPIINYQAWWANIYYFQKK